MFKTGTNIFFQEPTAATRLLHLSTVTEVEDQSVTAEFEGESIPLEVGQEFLCYFDGEGEFMQLIVRVVDVVAREPRLAAKLVAVGDPISAESRQTCRVPTISADILAEFGEEHALCVQDVSATGFAVIAKGSYPIGATFPVSITHEGDIYCGVAAIQSVRELRPGRMRYGLRALEEGPDAGDLLDGLHQIDMAVQRQQLKPGGGIG